MTTKNKHGTNHRHHITQGKRHSKPPKSRGKRGRHGGKRTSKPPQQKPSRLPKEFPSKPPQSEGIMGMLPKKVRKVIQMPQKEECKGIPRDTVNAVLDKIGRRLEEPKAGSPSTSSSARKKGRGPKEQAPNREVPAGGTSGSSEERQSKKKGFPLLPALSIAAAASVALMLGYGVSRLGDSSGGSGASRDGGSAPMDTGEGVSGGVGDIDTSKSTDSGAASAKRDTDSDSEASGAKKDGKNQEEAEGAQKMPEEKPLPLSGETMSKYRFQDAVIGNDTQTIGRGITSGISPNASSPFRKDMSWLMLAAEKGNIPAARVLLSAGARVRAENPTGKNALYFAAFYGQGEMARFLAGEGADFIPRKQPVRPDSPLIPPRWMDPSRAEELAERSKHAPDPEYFLKYHGFTRNPKRNPERVNPLSMIMLGYADDGLIEFSIGLPGACVNSNPAYGMGSPLVSAALMHRLRAVELLLDNGASPNSRDYFGVKKPRGQRWGRTALMAVVQGASESGEEEVLPIVELLLKRGADPDIAYKGKTAEMMARKAGNLKAAELLRNHGTNPKNQSGADN